MDLYREFVPFVFWAIVGNGILFGAIYLLMVFGGVRERITKALNDIETLKEKTRKQRDEIERLKRSIQKLESKISSEPL